MPAEACPRADITKWPHRLQTKRLIICVRSGAEPEQLNIQGFQIAMNAKLAPADITIDAILSELQPHLASAAQVQQARVFVGQFFNRVAEDDIAVRDAKTWAALLRGLLDFIRVRSANTPSVRVFNPTLENDGWESNYTVVQFATNDMPFLVDSVGIAAHEQGLSLHGLMHPVYFIARDAGGNLLSLATDESNRGKPESVMHLEVDRLSEPAEMERLQKALLVALHDVAAAVLDWPVMKAKMLEMTDNVGKGGDTSVETRKGEVLLSGFVDSQAQADREVQLAKSVDGVQSVQNKLMVKDGKSTAGNVLDDSVVTVKVKSALMADDRTRGTQFAVTTHKGVVQLSGFVDSADEQARATTVARNVEGVQSVVNDTSIKK